MGRLGFEKVFDCFSLSISFLCINSVGDEDEFYAVERESLVKNQGDQILRLKDVLEPRTVILRVSMHCNGCARRVEKHIKKMEGWSLEAVSITIFEKCSTDLLRDFYMDNEYRKEWDKTLNEHKHTEYRKRLLMDEKL